MTNEERDLVTLVEREIKFREAMHNRVTPATLASYIVRRLICEGKIKIGTIKKPERPNFNQDV